MLACTRALACYKASVERRISLSALVVHRSQFEALLRSVWLTYAAAEKDIEKLNANLDLDSEQAAKNILQAQDMLEALSKSGPKEAYDADVIEKFAIEYFSAEKCIKTSNVRI